MNNQHLMDLQTRKIKFIRDFLNIQDEKLISECESLLYNKEMKSLNSISSEELNNRIDQSEDDFKNGRYKTSAQLLEKYK